MSLQVFAFRFLCPPIKKATLRWPRFTPVQAVVKRFNYPVPFFPFSASEQWI
jgi:hypothetical protein